MKTGEDFKRALGTADPGFEARVHQTLYKLEHNEEDKPVKKLSVGFMVAIATVLVTVVAFAAATQWGVLDFINYQGRSNVLPDATGMIQSGVEQTGGQTDFATFTLREAVYDGNSMYLVVAAKPINEKTLLIGPDMMLSDGIVDLGPDFADRQDSVRDYAAQNGFTDVACVSISTSGAANGIATSCSINYVLESDNTLVFMLTSGVNSNDADLAVSLGCVTTPLRNPTSGDEFDIERQSRDTLDFTLSKSVTANALTHSQPVTYDDCGVQIDKVTLYATPIEIAYKIEFTVTDADAYAATDGGLWFEFIDAQGERLPDGVADTGSIEPVEGSEDTRFIQTGSLAASARMPDTITLRGYNCWEKNRYEAHEFVLTAAE